MTVRTEPSPKKGISVRSASRWERFPFDYGILPYWRKHISQDISFGTVLLSIKLEIQEAGNLGKATSVEPAAANCIISKTVQLHKRVQNTRELHRRKSPVSVNSC